MKNDVFQLVHGKKQHSLKQILLISYTLEKRFFEPVAFEGFQVVPFYIESKKLIYLSI